MKTWKLAALIGSGIAAIYYLHGRFVMPEREDNRQIMPTANNPILQQPFELAMDAYGGSVVGMSSEEILGLTLNVLGGDASTYSALAREFFDSLPAQDQMLALSGTGAYFAGTAPVSYGGQYTSPNPSNRNIARIAPSY